MTKGRIPIQKNISVVDEQGNIYEATYPKRARGLVKNGRARFISEDTICLTRPPELLEEHMSDTNIDINSAIKEAFAATEEALITANISSAVEEALEAADISSAVEEAFAAKETAFEKTDFQSNQNSATKAADSEKTRAFQSEKYSMDYVFEQIEKIANQPDYLGQVIGAIGHLENSEDCDSDAALEAKAMALGDVVRCRETTNQQLIRFYEKVYDNLRQETHIK